MFAALKADFANRSNEVAECWRLVDRIEQEELETNTSQPGLRTMKGLLFVHFYAVYEHIIVNSFASAVRQFNAYAMPFIDTKRQLLSLALHPHFQSVSDLAERRCWPSRISLIANTDSTSVASISDTLFPFDESHFRSAQLDTICEVFGMPLGSLIPHPRLRGWITEVVEHRNSIAHGRETAASVGGRYSSSDLDVRRGQMDVLCNHIVATLETHVANIANFRR